MLFGGDGMARTGRPPKEDRSQVRHRHPTMEWTEVPDVPFAGVSPDLPDAVDWTHQTQAWWEKIRRMPHCVMWTDTDWESALTTALVHTEVWAGSTSRANELRLREREIGTTDDARRALRIRYVSDAPPTAAAAKRPENLPANVRSLFRAG